MDADSLEQVDFLRLDANRGLKRKAEFGQFMTPAPVARLMASMFDGGDDIRLLDAGAAIGSLFSAAVFELCGRKKKPTSISVVAYEIDQHIATYLPDTISLCKRACTKAAVRFESEIVRGDFLALAAENLRGGLFPGEAKRFTHAILRCPKRRRPSSRPMK